MRVLPRPFWGIEPTVLGTALDSSPAGHRCFCTECPHARWLHGITIERLSHHPECFFARPGVSLACPDGRVRESPGDQLNGDPATRKATGEGVPEIMKSKATANPGDGLRGLEGIDDPAEGVGFRRAIDEDPLRDDIPPAKFCECVTAGCRQRDDGFAPGLLDRGGVCSRGTRRRSGCSFTAPRSTASLKKTFKTRTTPLM